MGVWARVATGDDHLVTERCLPQCRCGRGRRLLVLLLLLLVLLLVLLFGLQLEIAQRPLDDLLRVGDFVADFLQLSSEFRDVHVV